MLQAAGSWSVEACCAVPGNDCNRNSHPPQCWDRTSSSDWLFGLGPGPPQRFGPTGTDTHYQWVWRDEWPKWGVGGGGWSGDLAIGYGNPPGRSHGFCDQGNTYRGTEGEICGGNNNWGATDFEVWYPR